MLLGATRGCDRPGVLTGAPHGLSVKVFQTVGIVRQCLFRGAVADPDGKLIQQHAAILTVLSGHSLEPPSESVSGALFAVPRNRAPASR